MHRAGNLNQQDRHDKVKDRNVLFPPYFRGELAIYNKKNEVEIIAIESKQAFEYVFKFL